MRAREGTLRPRPWLVWTASLLASLVGLKYGYDFGERLSGTVLGVITGVNLAVFGGFVAGSAVKWMFGSHAANRDET